MKQRIQRLVGIGTGLTAAILLVCFFMWNLSATSAQASPLDGGAYAVFIEGIYANNGDFHTTQPTNGNESSIVIIPSTGVVNSLEVYFSREVTVSVNTGTFTQTGNIYTFTNDPDFVQQPDFSWDWTVPQQSESLWMRLRWLSVSGDSVLNEAWFNLTEGAPAALTSAYIEPVSYIMQGENLRVDVHANPMTATHPVHTLISVYAPDGSLAVEQANLLNTDETLLVSTDEYWQTGIFTATFQARNGFGWVVAEPVTFTVGAPSFVIEVDGRLLDNGDSVAVQNPATMVMTNTTMTTDTVTLELNENAIITMSESIYTQYGIFYEMHIPANSVVTAVVDINQSESLLGYAIWNDNVATVNFIVDAPSLNITINQVMTTTEGDELVFPITIRNDGQATAPSATFMIDLENGPNREIWLESSNATCYNEVDYAFCDVLDIEPGEEVIITGHFTSLSVGSIPAHFWVYGLGFDIIEGDVVFNVKKQEVVFDEFIFLPAIMVGDNTNIGEPPTQP